MDPRKATMMSLVDLPDDMLMTIVAKVGSASSLDYYNTIIASKHLHFGSDNHFIAKDLNLAPLLKNPLIAYKYKTLMDNCIQANNVNAIYVKGLLDYFHSQNQFLGLHHIRLAAKRGHKEGRYIYGVILMAIGQIEKGKKVINKLTDEEGITAVEDCWANIQVSISLLNFSMKDIYVTSLVQMHPGLGCHPSETNTVCSSCYHFFLMSEFFEMMMGLNKM